MSVSDCNFSATSWQQHVSFQLYEEEVHFVLDQHAKLDFYSANSAAGLQVVFGPKIGFFIGQNFLKNRV